MALFKSGNPVINEKIFRNLEATGDEVMTIGGTMKKFGLMLLMLIGGAAFTWDLYYSGVNVMPWAMGAAIGGFVVALIITFKKTWAPQLALGYALLEGLFLGAISAVLNAAFAEKYPGLIMQAVLLTFGVAVSMFALYYFRVLQATQTFKKVVIAATMGIALFYLASMVMNLFGSQMPYLHSNGPIGIGISLFVVAIAALNLIMDFDMIEQGAAGGAPKYFEWYSAFGLMVTIVWLYLEILRLLSKLASRK
ncbi:MAG: Bax inhibitor/YccA family protein [Flaviaesturariibacter sp.]|nr:Bax inhibitor/YccA family protein [Flaviaesturariibacter sp.]